MDHGLELRLFYLLLTWLAPAALWLHLSLLARPAKPAERTAVGASSCLALVLSLSALVHSLLAWPQRDWLLVWRKSVWLVSVPSLMLAALLLLHDHLHGASSLARRRAPLLAFGSIAAFMPPVFLSVVPENLGVPARLPYEFTLPCLAICPLTCGYSLSRRRVGRVEGILMFIAPYYLLANLLASVYLIASPIAYRLLGALAPDSIRLSAMLFGVGLALLFTPLARGLLRLPEWTSRRELDGARAAQHLAESLSDMPDKEALRRLLTHRLLSAMRLSGSALFLRGEDGTLVFAGAAGFAAARMTGYRLPLAGPVAACLQVAARPMADAEIRRALAGAPLTAEEQAFLSLTGATYWLPLVAGRLLQGLLLIGRKAADGSFTADDERILADLARQAGVAARHVYLIDQIRLAREELALAHRRLLTAAEQGQRELARELHDGAIQQLIGISFRLADRQQTLRAEGSAIASINECSMLLETVRHDVLDVVTQLRQLTAALRPEELEKLDLAAALRRHVTRLLNRNGITPPEITLDLADCGKTLPDLVGTALFRAAQETLRNALQHAGSQHIQISLSLTGGEIVLTVLDDGCGFRVPDCLGDLAWSDHFGLIGVSERIARIGGQLTIRSGPDSGTEVAIRVPVDRRGAQNGGEGSDIAG